MAGPSSMRVTVIRCSEWTIALPRPPALACSAAPGTPAKAPAGPTGAVVVAAVAGNQSAHVGGPDPGRLVVAGGLEVITVLVGRLAEPRAVVEVAGVARAVPVVVIEERVEQVIGVSRAVAVIRIAVLQNRRPQRRRQAGAANPDPIAAGVALLAGAGAAGVSTCAVLVVRRVLTRVS